MYDWGDLKYQCTGSWQDIVLSLTNIDAKFFNKRHQPCPCCGGNDRARWIEKKEVAYCNQCGGKDNGGTISPVNLIMDMNGWEFKTAVDEIGMYINAVPSSRIIANKKAFHNVSKNNLTYKVSNKELAEQAISKSKLAPFCALSLRHGIAPPELRIYQEGIIIPLIDSSEQLTNAVVIDINENVSFIAGSMSYGSFNRIGQDEGKSIFLCCDYFESCMVNHFTGCQVLYCVNPVNAKLVAMELNDDRICWASNLDFNELCEAEKAGCRVVLAVNGSIKKSRKLERKFTDVTTILDNLEAKRKNDEQQ